MEKTASNLSVGIGRPRIRLTMKKIENLSEEQVQGILDDLQEELIWEIEADKPNRRRKKLLNEMIGMLLRECF